MGFGLVGNFVGTDQCACFFFRVTINDVSGRLNV